MAGETDLEYYWDKRGHGEDVVVHLKVLGGQGLLQCLELWILYPCFETTKLTQELAVKLEQGRDLHQWHSMANWEVSGETLYGKSEDGKSPSEQDWGGTSWVRLGFIYCLGVYTRSTDILCYSTWGDHEEHSLDKWIISYRTNASHEEYMRDSMRGTWGEHEDG